LSQIISGFTAGSSLQYKYGDVFHGYAITLKGKDLDFVRQSKDIEYIEENGIMTIDYLYVILPPFTLETETDWML
jgi:hypothetical protein